MATYGRSNVQTRDDDNRPGPVARAALTKSVFLNFGDNVRIPLAEVTVNGTLMPGVKGSAVLEIPLTDDAGNIVAGCFLNVNRHQCWFTVDAEQLKVLPLARDKDGRVITGGDTPTQKQRLF